MRAHHLSLLGLLACASPPPTPAPVRPGIEVLLADSLHLVRGQRVGLLTNHTGVDRRGRRDVDLLRTARDVRVTALFTPEHGFRGTEDRPDLENAVDRKTGLPIYSVYGATRSPDVSALDSVDVLLIDLQDIGARYYTYVSTAVRMMRDAAVRGKRVVVLDRPNPIGGDVVQGNVRDTAGRFEPFVGFLPVPMRHGMTMGEMTRLANDVLDIGADLRVVPAAGWRRSMDYDATGLPWVNPSPNIPSLESAIHYPGLGLFEGTDLSVGRGTPLAFQVIGAPWLDAERVLQHLREAGAGSREEGALAGVELAAVTFTPRAPSDFKYDGVPLAGIRFTATDRERYDPTRLAVALLAAVRAVHPDSFRLRRDRIDLLAAGPGLREALGAGCSPAAIWEAWEAALARFRATRAKYLLY